MTVGVWLCTTAFTSERDAVDFAMDESLRIHGAAALLDGTSVEIEGHDVAGGHQRRRQ